MLQSSSSEKKIGKAIKRWAILSLIYTIKGWLWATPQIKNIFFSINKKRRSSAFRNFFYQNIRFGWVKKLCFLSYCVNYYILFIKQTKVSHVLISKNCIFQLSKMLVVGLGAASLETIVIVAPFFLQYQTIAN